MAAKENSGSYSECRQISRTTPDARVTEEIEKLIGSNYRTLPEFEQGLFEHVCIKHYSLQRNELLQCRWTTYKEHIEGRVFAPFQFPNVRDLHFYKGSVRFAPSESIHRFPEYRMKLKPGPGFDFRGQMPIPQELLMKRGKSGKQEGAMRIGVRKKRDE